MHPALAVLIPLAIAAAVLLLLVLFGRERSTSGGAKHR